MATYKVRSNRMSEFDVEADGVLNDTSFVRFYKYLIDAGGKFQRDQTVKLVSCDVVQSVTLVSE